jgi:hypothetical protein
MLAYYISGSNLFSFRTEPIGSSNLTLHLQNMYTLVNTSSSLSYTFDTYEGLLQFTASIPSASVGDEYRAHINDGTSSIWHGSLQVYTSQSLDKPNYINQIPADEQYISNITDNQYIILD